MGLGIGFRCHFPIAGSVYNPHPVHYSATILVTSTQWCDYCCSNDLKCSFNVEVLTNWFAGGLIIKPKQERNWVKESVQPKGPKQRVYSKLNVVT